MSSSNENIRAGIITREQIDEEPYGFGVEWLEWDSEFRKTDLKYQDIVIGVNDHFYLKENREKQAPKAIGNYLETVYWSEQAAVDGQMVTLHLYRKGNKLSVQGRIHSQRQYLNANNKQILGVNGPERLGRDGFSSPWASWYEQFTKHAELYLTDRLWIRSIIDNRRLLNEHLEWKPRVDFLKHNYPGQFSEAVVADWEEVF